MISSYESFLSALPAQEIRRSTTSVGDYLGHRQIIVGSGAGETTNAELCSGFTVSGGEARTVDTLYMDVDIRERYTSSLIEWQNAWNNDKLNNQEIQQLLLSGQALPAVNAFSAKHADLLNKVTRSLDREFYWEASEYTLVLRVTTSRPDEQFTFSGTFELSEVEVEKLRGNFTKMLIELCDFRFFPHEFVWPRIRWAHL